MGISLKYKFGDKPEKLGIKKFILNISLPATILISFISFEIELDFLYLPLAGIALNLFVFLLSPSILKITRIKKASKHLILKVLALKTVTIRSGVKNPI